MAKYDALVTVRVTHEYVVRLEVEADNETDAADKLTHHAQGLTGKQIEALVDDDDESAYEGESREVMDIFAIEQLPEESNTDE